jgi:O-antigen ligase
MIILQVFISSLLSDFVSFQSVIYAVIFSIFVLFSFVVYRSIKSLQDINKMIDLFIIIVVISTIIDILDIVRTGNLRAIGLMGYAIMDFAVIVLLFFIFRNYLFGKTNMYIHISSFLVFLLIIFHQSRFAWLGFILSLIYGIIITLKYYPNVKMYFRKKAVTYIVVSIVFIGVVIVFGYNEIILSRISEINFDFFQGTPEEGQYLSNSLESRLLIWITAYNTFIGHPFFGVGYFMFPLVSEQYNILPMVLYRQYVENLDAHTTYFNLLVDTGLFGFTLFLAYFILMFRISLRSLKLSVTENQKSLSIVISIFCFFILVHSAYAGAFTFGLNAFHMWFMFALNLSNYTILKKNRV